MKATRWEKALAIVCHVLILILSLAVFGSIIQNEGSDLSIHTVYARAGNFHELDSFFHSTANPMWHVLVVLLSMTGVPLFTSAVIITAICKLLVFALTHYFFTRWLRGSVRQWVITLLAVACSVVSSLCWPWYNPTVYLGAGSPNLWHSATHMIAMVWMPLCVVQIARVYDEFVRLEPEMGPKTVLDWKELCWLCFLLLCSLASKPSFMQVCLPASCLFFLFKWFKYPKNSRYFLQVLGWVTPAIILMILQYMYYFGIIVPVQSEMVLEVSWNKVGTTLIMVLLMQAFPMYALWVTRQQPKDTLYCLTLLMDVVGIVEFLILGENGIRAADGNFGWGMMSAVLMLWMVTLPRFVKARSGEAALTAGKRTIYGVGWVLLGWHLVSGIYYIWYLLSTGAAL
ncbi:MAG: hypothetical protein J6K73_10150 [Clostridia bacterium]|nr:hypothetical protein [Clostridia bacterium]